MPPEPLNFNLIITYQGPEYRVRAESNVGGEALSTFSIPFSDDELNKIIYDLCSFDITILKEFGGRLFDAIFTQNILRCFQSSLISTQQLGQDLRIRINLTDTPELARMPWEFLYDKATDRFLALSVATPMIRYLDLPEPVPSLAIEPPLRVLALLSAPDDQPTLNIQLEWENLERALSFQTNHTALVVDRQAVATLQALQEKLLGHNYHIFHFIGHGVFSEHRQVGQLIFEDKNKKSDRVSGEQLSKILANQRSLRIVVLNACEGAIASSSDSFTGVAQTLVRQGIPAVVAMQSQITDSAAITFSRTFYAALVSGRTIDSALAEARVAIFAGGNEVEWGVPVIYTRSPNGKIFHTVEEEKAGAAADIPEVKWDLRGTLWLVSGLVGIALLAGLGYLFLTPWPILQGVVTTIIAVLTTIFGILGLREDRSFFPNLSQMVGKLRPLQIAMAATLILSLLGWGLFGRTLFCTAMYGELGCPMRGVKRFAIGEWKSLSPNTPNETSWTEGTRNALYQKLYQVKSLQSILELNEVTKKSLDFFITGTYEKIQQVKLSANLSGKSGQYLGSAQAEGVVDEQQGDVQGSMLALQNQLAYAILQQLGIEITEALSDTIRHTPTDNPDALRLNNQGVDLSNAGDLQAAKNLFQAAIVLDPKYADPYSNLGSVLAAQGNYSDAVASIQQAIGLIPGNPLYYHALASTLDRSGNYTAAVQAYQQVITLDPGFVRAYNNLGFTYLEMHDVNQAEEILKQGLQLDPTRYSLHKNLGRVYLEKGEWDKAVESLRQAVELSPGRTQTETLQPLPQQSIPDRIYVEALFYLALAYREQGKNQQACSTLNEYDPVAKVDLPERITKAQQLRQELACP